jgi:hypothetical protein
VYQGVIPPGRKVEILKASLPRCSFAGAQDFTLKEVKQMGSKKTAGIVLLVVGIVVLLLSLAADPIGIGSYPGFGYYQIVGAIVGAIVAIVGLILTLKR